jgi:hypothetical protein
MTRLTLLGPQRLQPTLATELARLGIQGPIATVTAGWQERESDDRELHEHLGGQSINLRLWERAETVFGRDPELAAAHRRRQEQLRALQDNYDLRLRHAIAAVHDLRRRRGDRGAGAIAVETLAEEVTAAIAAVRELDARHLARVGAVHAEFDAAWRPHQRPEVRRNIEAIQALLAGCAAIAIAGGHVAVLLNRLRLFDLPALLGQRAVVAWSAGAMVVCERIILFHDHPPQGPGNAEVLEVGLGLARDLVPLPHARRRLDLDDPERVALFAQRFAPAACIPMNEGACLDVGPSGWRAPAGCLQLLPDGAVGAR